MYLSQRNINNLTLFNLWTLEVSKIMLGGEGFASAYNKFLQHKQENLSFLRGVLCILNKRNYRFSIEESWIVPFFFPIFRKRPKGFC